MATDSSSRLQACFGSAAPTGGARPKFDKTDFAVGLMG
jgi:hypothetical protein